jgi:Pretoxin HINT domain
MVRTIVLFCALVAWDGADDDKTRGPSPTDLARYQEIQSKAGRDADSQVRLALWCEAHGLTAERLRHLSLAVLNDPANTLARGLMGLVAYQGKWDRPDVVGRQIHHEPAHQALIREYLDRRVRTPEKADAQLKLAAWCDEKGLKEQALAHYTAVTRLDPSRETAWKHLGFKKQGNRWVKPEEVAAARQALAHQKTADKHWRPRLEKLRDGLESRDGAKRVKAEQLLTEVTDPRAVPMIWAIFVRGTERLQNATVQMLGQIDGPSASNGLAVLAVFSPNTEVRRRAIATLARRDSRDVVGRLIGLVHKPYKYQVRQVNGPGSPGELFVEGERFNIQRFYQNQTTTPAMAQGRLFTPDMPFDPYSIRNIAMATMSGITADRSGLSVIVTGKPGYSVSLPMPLSTQSAAQAGQAIKSNPQNATAIMDQLVTDPANRYTPPGLWSALMNQGNATHPRNATPPLKPMESNAANQQAGAAMEEMLFAESQAARRDILIAQNLEQIREANQDLERRLAMDVYFLDATNDGINMFNARALPVLKAITGRDLGVEPEKWKAWWTDQLGYSYQSDVPETKPTFTDFIAEAVLVPSYVHSACFAAGTTVHTLDGPRPIETIRVGDQVLSQGTSSGQLAFQPVVATHRNPPASTLRITIGGETIVATGIHRFWKASKGWTMARELKAGDRLRVVGGTVAIVVIEADQTQPVYNLDVAENRDFFVGTLGLLVHDFSFVQPVFDPFDHAPDLAAFDQ